MRYPLPAAIAVLSMLVASAWAEVEDVPLSKLPVRVLAAVQERFPNGRLAEATREVDGKRYEVTVKSDGRGYDVTVTERGVIERIDKELTAAELPKAVKGTLDKAYPKVVLKSLIEVTRILDGKEVDDGYRAHLDVPGDRPVQVRIDRDGSLRKP